MILGLIRRPVAVLLSFALLLGLGIYFFDKIPVSLLPTIDVPRIIVSVPYRDHNATQVEENVLKILRDGMLTLDQIDDIQSKSANHGGTITLRFHHGTRMDLAYVEVNEKLDRLIQFLPRDLVRPLVTRVNTSDIPVIRLNILPAKADIQLEALSDLTTKILKKRIEQIDGISIVDINGQSHQSILVIPDPHALTSYGLSASDISAAIRSANQELGSLSMRDGQYRYFVRVANVLRNLEQIKNIPIKTIDGYIPLYRIASVSQSPEKPLGYHMYKNSECLVMTIQKQANARMTKLMPDIYKTIEDFKKDYPQIRFEITRDQKFLLDAGISNLYQDVLYGSMFTIVLLFIFLGHWSSPTLMSISIPLSLVISIIFYYWWDVSFNIISLSGVALGIGMLIDNSIVVIDHISRKRKSGLSLEESAVIGTNEMVAPVISQVLTTVAVYAPLVLLHGMAGDLIKDQAKALTISLAVSLMVAFVLAPMLYKKLIGWISKGQIKEDTIFYQWVERVYHRMIDHILRHRLFYFLFTLLLMPVGIWLATMLPVRALPKIEKTESLVHIDWNEQIDAQENKSRYHLLLDHIQNSTLVTEGDIGIKQFILQENQQNIQECEIYFACRSEADKDSTDFRISSWLSKNYAKAIINILDAPSAFTQLFVTDQSMLDARFTILNAAQEDSIQKLYRTLSSTGADIGASMQTETLIEVVPDYKKMALYGITRQNLDQSLEQIYGAYHLTDLVNSGDMTKIKLVAAKDQVMDPLSQTIKGNNGESYPLSLFISMHYTSQPKYLSADRSGLYQNIFWEQSPRGNIKSLQNKIISYANTHGISVHFTGQYFDDQSQLKQLGFIFIIVVLLMYFILAIQYESVTQPFLVMLTIPLGITGAMFALWVTSGSLDTMAAIGFIVILGLIVDDPILKIETLNRLNKQYTDEGLVFDEALLKKMIHEAGSICLKPLLMVSLTTSVALVPVLFIPGLGNELQKPMAWVIIGGLTIGTFFTTWFIPLAYWYWRKIFKSK